ncbi:TraR/DksA family transcriptional regulator [Sphingomonas molluscorum]|uniref:TraR/DksA family transcriptional regulator n=1 Tax=Sphingomonas molluscorum TaxID=418184 RepID=UPI0031D607FA
MAHDLDRARERLLAKRAALVEEDRQSEADRAPVALDQESVGRLSRIDAMQVQAMALAAQRRRAQERDRIDAALRRIDDGDYGWCVTCGEEIAPARLAHAPEAPTCLTCARGD